MLAPTQHGLPMARGKVDGLPGNLEIGMIPRSWLVIPRSWLVEQNMRRGVGECDLWKTQKTMVALI